MGAAARAYRVRAEEQRAAAAQETLRNRREIHEQSAMLWDRLAQELEDTERLTVDNAAANAARKASMSV
jgi:dTDP-4-amino-4,6-dideoxygalactose transaminase